MSDFSLRPAGFIVNMKHILRRVSILWRGSFKCKFCLSSQQGGLMLQANNETGGCHVFVDMCRHCTGIVLLVCNNSRVSLNLHLNIGPLISLCSASHLSGFHRVCWRELSPHGSSCGNWSFVQLWRSVKTYQDKLFRLQHTLIQYQAALTKLTLASSTTFYSYFSFA